VQLGKIKEGVNPPDKWQRNARKGGFTCVDAVNERREIVKYQC
jgi:hypothetical protein